MFSSIPLLFYFFTSVYPQTYNIYVNTTNPVHTVPPEFLSYALDMTIIYDTNDCWGFNFSYIEPLAKAISPGYLRLGGTYADVLVFENTTVYNNSILSSAQLDLFYKFSQDVGFRFLIDLNALLRSGAQWNTSVWNSTNAQAFLNYASAKGYSMDFELGNEPEGYQSFFNLSLTSTQMINDYQAFRTLIKSYAIFNNSKIVGPAANGVGSWDTLINDFLNNGGKNYINSFTFHHYYMGNANYSQWIDPTVMNTLVPVLEAAQNTSFPSLWLGETGSTWNNDPNADTFIAGFWWMDKLGLSALYGLEVVIRFTFYGGTSTLISDAPYMQPVPDYWLSLLYKKLVGQQIYSLTFSPANQYLRLYAASSTANDGSFVVYGMTLTNSTTTLNFPNISNNQATLYLLKEGVLGNLTVNFVTLNGQYLSWSSHEYESNLQGNRTTLPITLPAFSQFFLVLNQNIATSCPTGWYQETSHPNKCIQIFNQTQPMFAAKFDCTIFGPNATILSIDNAAENNETMHRAQNSGCTSVYLGLIRWVANTTTWSWINGDSSSYRNWKSGYPLNSATQLCAVLNPQNGTWMDTDCDFSYCYACQIYI